MPRSIPFQMPPLRAVVTDHGPSDSGQTLPATLTSPNGELDFTVSVMHSPTGRVLYGSQSYSVLPVAQLTRQPSWVRRLGLNHDSSLECAVTFILVCSHQSAPSWRTR